MTRLLLGMVNIHSFGILTCLCYLNSDYTSVPPSKRRRMSQMRSVSPQESNTVILKTELINGPNALPSTSQQTQVFITFICLLFIQ